MAYHFPWISKYDAEKSKFLLSQVPLVLQIKNVNQILCNFPRFFKEHSRIAPLFYLKGQENHFTVRLEVELSDLLMSQIPREILQIFNIFSSHVLQPKTKFNPIFTVFLFFPFFLYPLSLFLHGCWNFLVLLRAFFFSLLLSYSAVEGFMASLVEDCLPPPLRGGKKKKKTSEILLFFSPCI